MVVGVFLVRQLGLVIVDKGILFYWNMLLKKCWTLLLDSESKTLIFKSPEKKSFLESKLL